MAHNIIHPNIHSLSRESRAELIKMAIVVAPATSPHVLLDGHRAGNSRLALCLKECTDMATLKQIHAQSLRSLSPHHHNHLFVYSQILRLSSLFDLDYAFRVFDQIESPNSFMWNTLIRACARSKGREELALMLYWKLLEQTFVCPDKHTFPFLLRGCAYLFALSEGQQVHGHALKLGCGSDVYVCNSLMHLYASCGCLDQAEKVFAKMPERSTVSWNVMVEGFVQAGEFESALRLFSEMQELVHPDEYTMQSVASACAGLHALSLGMWAHAYMLRKFDVDTLNDVLINNSLVDMYCKCGSVESARQLFERMPKRDVTSWNHMIFGLAMHGQAEAAIEYFERLVETEPFSPNSITFVGVLSACNHRGLVDEGFKYFELMNDKYKIKPVLEHYGCLVDLVARAGYIDRALDVVYKMPMRPDMVIWRSLLDACRKKNASVGLSEEMSRQILNSGGNTGSGVYVLLSKVYASASRWNDVGSVRRLMTEKGVAKEPGCSSIEIDGVVHELFAGDTSHPQREKIYQMLDLIDEKLRLAGHSPDCLQAYMVDEEDERKIHSLRLHSERLAIALGLLQLPPGTPIRIFKNLRVCSECHEVTRLISKVFNVEISVRDRLRFHHFKDGSCSCRNYW